MKKCLMILGFMFTYFLSIPVGAAEEVHSDVFVAGAADGVRYEYKPLLRVVAEPYDRFLFRMREYTNEDNSFIGEYEINAIVFRKYGTCIYEVKPITGPVSQYAAYSQMRVLGEAERDAWGRNLESMIQLIVDTKDRFQVRRLLAVS